MNRPMNLAFFISPHGFGHAARACAVMSAITRCEPRAHFDIFTRVPEWFFRQSLSAQVRYRYHELLTDIGFVQASSMVEDYAATIEALGGLYPLKPSLIEEISRILIAGSVKGVLCDISVLGIEVARAVGIPSVLIENFTWDWIYAEYVRLEPRFAPFIEYLAPLYSRASLRIQAAPVCNRCQELPQVPPIAREQRAKRGEVRAHLGIPEDAPMVVCSMGGVPASFSFIPALASHSELIFVLAGCAPSASLPSNVRAVPYRSDIYHPDLVAAADAVVGKVGYSTVAEAYYGRTQFLFLPRPLFAESAVMERFVRDELNGHPIEAHTYDDGSWVKRVPSLLQTPKPRSDSDQELLLLLELLRGVW